LRSRRKLFDQSNTQEGSAGMADYKLILDGARGFGVEVTARDGFRSIRGFPTEVDALLWIAEQAARDADAAVTRDLPAVLLAAINIARPP
jgi:hypothetical protein